MKTPVSGAAVLNATLTDEQIEACVPPELRLLWSLHAENRAVLLAFARNVEKADGLALPAPAHERDRDWIVAIADALGLNSGFDVPIVPQPEPFKRLFAAVRARGVPLLAADREGFAPLVRHPDGRISTPGTAPWPAPGTVLPEATFVAVIKPAAGVPLLDQPNKENNRG